MFVTLTPEGPMALPDLGTLSLQTIKTVLLADPAERLMVLVELVASPEAIDVIDLLSPKDFQSAVLRWEADAGVTLSELFQIAGFIDDHPGALEADLIDKGMRLRHFPSEDHTWGDLKVIIEFLSVHSSLYAAVHPDRAGWDKTNMLLADVADSMHWNNWAQTKDGKKGRNRPKPIPRPGIEQQPERAGSKPKPSPLSAIKETFARRYGTDDQTSKPQKLNALFGRR